MLNLDDVGVQRSHLAVTKAPNVAIGIAGRCPLFIPQRDFANCRDGITFGNHLMDLELGRLFVRGYHPLANVFLPADSSVAQEGPLRIFGAMDKKSFKVAL